VFRHDPDQAIVLLREALDHHESLAEADPNAWNHRRPRVAVLAALLGRSEIKDSSNPPD
jgi:hypothetical protein